MCLFYLKSSAPFTSYEPCGNTNQRVHMFFFVLLVFMHAAKAAQDSSAYIVQ